MTVVSDVVADVVAVNYLMRRPTTFDEARRVVHALGLAGYELRKRPPETASKPARKRKAARS